jgi:hypothetical protein
MGRLHGGHAHPLRRVVGSAVRRGLRRRQQRTRRLRRVLAIDASSAKNRLDSYGARRTPGTRAGAVISRDYQVLLQRQAGLLCSVATDTAGYASPAGTHSRQRDDPFLPSLSKAVIFTLPQARLYYKSETSTPAQGRWPKFPRGSSPPQRHHTGRYNGRIYVGASDGIYGAERPPTFRKSRIFPPSCLLLRPADDGLRGTVYAYFSRSMTRGARSPCSPTTARTFPWTSSALPHRRSNIASPARSPTTTAPFTSTE